MKAIIVISLELPEPDNIIDALDHIKPPSIPHFAGKVRVAIDPEATTVIRWLDDETDPPLEWIGKS